MDYWRSPLYNLFTPSYPRAHKSSRDLDLREDPNKTEQRVSMRSLPWVSVYDRGAALMPGHWNSALSKTNWMLTTASHEGLSNQIHPGKQPTNDLIHEEQQRDQKAGLFLFLYTERPCSCSLLRHQQPFLNKWRARWLLTSPGEASATFLPQSLQALSIKAAMQK